LHRRHTWQAAGGAGRAEEGRRHRGTKRLRATEVVEAGRMAVPKSILLTTNWPSELHYGSLEMSVFLAAMARGRDCQEKIRASRTEPFFIRAHSQTAAIFKIAPFSQLGKNRAGRGRDRKIADGARKPQRLLRPLPVQPVAAGKRGPRR